MNTFLISSDPTETASILDNKRLGKQRVEVIQILNILLGVTQSRSWYNHPAVKMWKGYEPFLLKVYLRAFLNEFKSRGFKNDKCEEHYTRLLKILSSENIAAPTWFSKDFFKAHKSNLLRKDNAYYSQFFTNIPDDLPYIWPVREVKPIRYENI